MPTNLPIWDQRMILLMRHCVDSGICTSQADFLETIGLLPQGFTQVKNGQRSFTLEHIAAAARKYKVNVNWIMGLEETMFRAKKKSALQNLKDAVRAIEAESK